MLTAHEIMRKRIEPEDRIQWNDGFIVIDPWDEDQLNPNSYNLTLSDTIGYYSSSVVLDAKKRQAPLYTKIPKCGLTLQPGQLYLGCTAEYTESHNLVPMINGRSSLARLGVSIHQTGGFGDIGFCGNWTLEITCIREVVIYAGMQIAQICWLQPVGLVDRTYNGKYQGSKSDMPVDSLISTEMK